MAVEKIKIMYFVQSLGKGGAERLVLDICNELNSRTNAEYRLVSFSEVNDYQHLTENVSFSICHASIKLSIYRKNVVHIDELIEIIEDFKPNVIHSNVYLCEILTREKLYPNIRYFTHCHDNMIEFRPFAIKTIFSKKRLSQYYEKKRMLNKYKAINNYFLAISRDTEQYFVRAVPRSLKKNVIYFPNAIKYETFYCSDERKIQKDSIRLINIGHFSNKKNQSFLIDVVAELIKSGIMVHLQLVGDYLDQKELIINRAKEKNVLHNIEIIGLVENVEAYLKNADIYVHSALYESFGLVLVEAMASGLPVVSLDGKGNRDIIEDGKNGFMIQEPDAVIFAKRIVDLIETPQLYSGMSNYARKFAARFDIKSYVDRLLSLYKNAR